MLILCGSAVSVMKAMLAESAPLHQRASAIITVEPFGYEAAGEFSPTLAPEDRAVIYGVLGGIPLYLKGWRAEETRRENLLRLFADASSPLVDAGDLTLSSELVERENHYRILQAIALGKTKSKDIGDYAQVAIERPLQRLALLGIIRRCVPAFDHPTKTKRALYRIADPFLRFWFRYIHPNRGLIDRGLGEHLVDEIILPTLDDYMGPVFEQMAREHAQRLSHIEGLEPGRVEEWWNTDSQHQIDLVGMAGRHEVRFIGEAKWTRDELDWPVLNRLDQHASFLPGVGPGTPRLLYGRGGCVAPLRKRPLVYCFSIDDL
ncbi:MAG: ATP-binding protein, partial [Chloroflexota bacterium]